MDTQLANYFFSAASNAFQFLTIDKHFALPTLDVDDQINFATVTFLGKNVAIECILDERDEDVDCKIARVVDGAKVLDYAVDKTGKRVRESLAALLRRRGLRDRIFHDVKGLALRYQITIILEDFALMLRTHASDILNDSPTMLDD